MSGGLGLTLMTLGMLTVAADAPPQPIRLEVAAAGDTLTLRVVGAAASAVDAQFSLNVVSGAGGNRSIHSGAAHLVPNQRQTLSTVAMSIKPGQPWTATLDVRPTGAESYSVTRASD